MYERAEILQIPLATLMPIALAGGANVPAGAVAVEMCTRWTAALLAQQADSACWNSCYIKHGEKRADKHYFSCKAQEDVSPIVTIKGILIFMQNLFSSLWLGDLYRLLAVHKGRKIPQIFHYVIYSSRSIHYTVYFPINPYYQINVIFLLHPQCWLPSCEMVFQWVN